MYQHDVIVNFFDVATFLFSILVIGLSFMSISLLIVELWQYLFVRDWKKFQKSEIPPLEFRPTPEDWG